MPGLKKDSPDYNYVYQKFWNEEDGYDVDSYDGEAIWKDHAMPHFRDAYDLKQFKQSLYRMISRIKNDRNSDSPPAKPTGAAVPDQPPATAPTEEGSKTPPPKVPPQTVPPSSTSIAGIPPQELVPNDEYLLCLPHHLFGWKDAYENDRLTLMVFLPTGCTKVDVFPRIVGGGTQVAIEYKWPNGMVDPRLPMYAGTRTGKAFYANGHVKVISFKESVRRLKNNDGERTIKSVFRKDLPTTVEEQFSDIDVPAALATVRYKVKAPLDQNGIPTGTPQEGLCLVLEMMCHRTHYKSCEIEDFVLDFNSLQI